MAVVGTDGSRFGQVANVDLEHFERDGGPMGRARLGYDSIRSIIGEEVVLEKAPDLDKDP